MRGLIFILLAVRLTAATTSIPEEPVRIGHEPQFLFDRYIVDNSWAIRYKRQAVQRVVHQAKKHADNPVLKGVKPSYTAVVHDAEAGLFRMYYQANFLIAGDGIVDTNQETLPETQELLKKKGRKFRTHIAYAESKDGINWTRPGLNLFAWHKRKPNNIVIGVPDNAAIETFSSRDGNTSAASRNCRNHSSPTGSSSTGGRGAS